MKLSDLNSIVLESVQKSKNRFEIWSYILNRVDAKNICEVGVWKGDYAKYLLDHVNKIENGRKFQVIHCEFLSLNTLMDLLKKKKYRKCRNLPQKY